jgi:HSP20 family protein
MSNLLTKKQSDGLAPIQSLQNQVGKLFDNFFDGFEENFFSKHYHLAKTFQPKVNISETDKIYLIEANLAGIKKDNVEIECKDNTLSISAKKEEKKEEENKNYHRFEYSCGSFYRSFQLPSNIEQKDISAEMKDGVLKVIMPKGDKHLSETKQITIE